MLFASDTGAAVFNTIKPNLLGPGLPSSRCCSHKSTCHSDSGMSRIIISIREERGSRRRELCFVEAAEGCFGGRRLRIRPQWPMHVFTCFCRHLKNLAGLQMCRQVALNISKSISQTSKSLIHVFSEWTKSSFFIPPRNQKSKESIGRPIPTWQRFSARVPSQNGDLSISPSTHVLVLCPQRYIAPPVRVGGMKKLKRQPNGPEARRCNPGNA